mmetsp:Transcript_127849/g.368177  ORF Transcript_127849/g.368177 Transcript_127849/m.368177 type:complete len:176 (-) Transcript_127849:121-648(-)
MRQVLLPGRSSGGGAAGGSALSSPAAPAAPSRPSASPGSANSKADDEGLRASGLDAQALQETAERAKQGARQLFGNLNGWFREAQSAVAEKLAEVSQVTEESTSQIGARIRRTGEKLEKASSKSAGNAEREAQKAARRDLAMKDAAQYFVEYKGLDYSLLPPEMLEPPTKSRGHA